MEKYRLTYKGKEYNYNGANTSEVMEKFSNRKVFGNPLVYNFSLRQYDADTEGEVWAEYKADDDFISIKRADA